jgi:hypothetical protein
VTFYNDLLIIILVLNTIQNHCDAVMLGATDGRTDNTHIQADIMSDERRRYHCTSSTM